MDYRYKKNQIFRKVLPVPNHIRTDVYDCKLTFVDFIAYNLEDKVPISCLIQTDRDIVEKFGIERAKTLDWSLLEAQTHGVDSIKEILLRFSKETEDLNDALYKALNHKLSPLNYSEGMKKKYPNREIKINENDSMEIQNVKKYFNQGIISLEKIIIYWDYFKDKDLTFALANDSLNTTKLTDKEVKDFMNEFRYCSLFFLNNSDIYELIRKMNTYETEDEKLQAKKSVCEETLDKVDENKDTITLDNNQYKELFRYVSMKEYLSKKVDKFFVDGIYRDLEYDGLTQEYLLNSGIPLEYLKERGTAVFIHTYGIKNIVEFDRECGNFFTKDDCRMLRNMYALYLHYASFDTKASDSSEYRTYTKDEFYEAMRRMIIGGPTDRDLKDQAPDYREMTGEFKRKNSSLFLQSDAPEELKRLFYKKSLTPKCIRDNPEYIQFLEGKELSACFQKRTIQIEDNETYMKYENFYEFLGKRFTYLDMMDFIKEYSDTFDFIFTNRLMDDYNYRLTFKKDDDSKQVIEKVNNMLIKVLIEKNMVYPQNIPKELYKEHPEIFLSNDAPKELQKAFYSRTLTTKMLVDNPTYREFLKGKDLQLIYKYMPVAIMKKQSTDDSRYIADAYVNLVKIIQDNFQEDALQTMIDYGNYIEELHTIDGLRELKLKDGFTKEEILDKLDEALLNGIIKNGMKYDEKIAGHFKGKNPTLFLDDKVDQNLKDKFYNRKFTIQDFVDNPELIDVIGDANIICGFKENLSWLIPIIKGENQKHNNLIRLKIMTEYYKIQDVSLQNVFKEYIERFKEDINLKTLSCIAEVLIRLSTSNSQEMYNFRNELAHQILNTDNPIESLNKIESVFIKNSIPTVGKTYSCFEILHPDFKGFNMSSNKISPVLKETGNRKRKYIVFNDLLKASLGSNNRSINKYLEDLDKGYKLYTRVKTNNLIFENLSYENQELLKKFRRIINTLYDRTLKSKKLDDGNIYTEDVVADIKLLEEKLAETDTEYSLTDRVVRMFCFGTGINTIEEAQQYTLDKISKADKRNRKAAENDMVLECGDLVKGINDMKYLRNILQNGSVSKEYLGSSATSDATPLDTDISMILREDGTTREKISSTNANGYGNIWIVLKKDDRFEITRIDNETHSSEYNPDKLELFHTGVLGKDHYGIRTGFASSEINYIVMEKYDTRVGLEIALNGFYIPVVNKDGKVVFTPEDYEEIRTKMQGLSYYDEPNYVFSENLVSDEIHVIAKQIEDNNKVTKYKREIINQAIKEALSEMNLNLKTSIDGDLTHNFVELIDIGSTGRGTNLPGDGDFDFMMRLDRAIMEDQAKLNKLKQLILDKLGVDKNKGVISTGDFRIKGVNLKDITVDIDITFTTKTDAVLYSTDMALQDRLETIKKQDEKKYNYVIANILQAKQVLQKANAYKPNRGDKPEGGIGGVGVENWILQHGGSFYDAAKSFVAAAEGKSFEDFLHTYEIWDFGDNHLAEKKGKYPHDEFVANNMSREGFLKMTSALKEYLKQIEKNRQQEDSYQM